MNSKILPSMILLSVLFFSSCFGLRNRRTAIVPVPDTDFFDFTLPVIAENITETQTGKENLPVWLNVYINDGIKAVERMDSYYDKYLFLAMSEGSNFFAMARWAEHFSLSRDTILLVARRIEETLVSAAALYPDDEYGSFYQSMILNAYSNEYPGAVKEDTYWIKMKVDNYSLNTAEGFSGTEELYVFFVLISFDKTALQEVIMKMISDSTPASDYRSRRSRRNAVERIQQSFFEDF